MNELPTPQNPRRHRMIEPTEPIVTERNPFSVSKPDMVPRAELERVERECAELRAKISQLEEAAGHPDARP